MLRPILPVLFLLAARAYAQSPDSSDWGYTGGDAYGQRYSSLAEIDRVNVNELQVAWEFRTGEMGAGLARAEKMSFEATPVLAYGLLYLTTPTDIVYALDPATGKQRWRFDPRIDRSRPYAEVTSRGVGVWEDEAVGAKGPCLRRVFFGTLDARLIALDADTGKLCVGFGQRGVVDLAQGTVARDRENFRVVSPPAVYEGLVIVPGGRGPLRAFDARSGAVRWTFNGASTSTTISVDPNRGLVLVPADRANALVALDAPTGTLLWRRELMHRDLWNLRLSAQPTLIDLELNGAPLSAVVQATETGLLFVLERDSGAPLFPVVEQSVPASLIAGVHAAPTQPFPTTPLLANLEPIDARNIWGLTFLDRALCRRSLARHRNEGVYTPPDEQGAIVSPGVLGGVSGGGVAFDVRRQRVVLAVNQLPMLATYIRKPDTVPALRRKPWLSIFGYPCTAPPWGTLVNVDLRSNKIVWQVPLGSTEGFGPRFMPTRSFGSPLQGAPIVTAADLVFVGGATDDYLRAFDLETGRELWKYRLPAGGQATPITYRAGPKHRQYVVMVAGGNGRLGTRRGDYVVAFTLPAARSFAK